MTSKYHESDSKARGAVRSVGAKPSVLCLSRGGLMSYSHCSACAVPLHYLTWYTFKAGERKQNNDEGRQFHPISCSASRRTQHYVKSGCSLFLRGSNGVSQVCLRTFYKQGPVRRWITHRLILKDGAVPAIKDPGEDSELEMASEMALNVLLVIVLKCSSLFSAAHVDEWSSWYPSGRCVHRRIFSRRNAHIRSSTVVYVSKSHDLK